MGEVDYFAIGNVAHEGAIKPPAHSIEFAQRQICGKLDFPPDNFYDVASQGAFFLAAAKVQADYGSDSQY